MFRYRSRSLPSLLSAWKQEREEGMVMVLMTNLPSSLRGLTWMQDPPAIELKGGGNSSVHLLFFCKLAFLDSPFPISDWDLISHSSTESEEEKQFFSIMPEPVSQPKLSVHNSKLFSLIDEQDRFRRGWMYLPSCGILAREVIELKGLRSPWSASLVMHFLVGVSGMV